MVGPGAAIDTRRYQVCSLDYLSSGDIEVNSGDQAHAVAGMLDELGIERAHAVVGASYGGMVALSLGAQCAERVSHLVVINAAHESHPMATAWRLIQRRIVTMGVEAGRAHDGMAIARMLAITTYRSSAEFAQRWPAGSVDDYSTGSRSLEAYLDGHGARFAARFTAEHFLSLSLSLDRHQVAPEAIMVPITLIGTRSDVLVPVTQLRNLHQRLSVPSRYFEIDSLYGHDSFLKEPDLLTPILMNALAETT
jgi:homoserine O-acetyltransferase